MAVKEDTSSEPAKKAAPKKSAAKTTKAASKTSAKTSTKPSTKAKAPTKSKSRKRAVAAKVPSEGDVLKMTDAQYMNASQLAFFQDRLRQMEEDILSNADETTEHLRETVIVPDPADRATIEEEHALELRTRDRERKLLKKVQQSLVRITEGEYGYCEETGEPIGVGRLIARPTATLSLEAQQRRELRQKMFGD
jgi:DnaK suppressor protein